jgi:hypothetical protein
VSLKSVLKREKMKLRQPLKRQLKKKKKRNKLQLKVMLESSLHSVMKTLIHPSTLKTERLGFKHNAMLTRTRTLTNSSEPTDLINS